MLATMQMLVLKVVLMRMRMRQQRSDERLSTSSRANLSLNGIRNQWFGLLAVVPLLLGRSTHTSPAAVVGGQCPPIIMPIMPVLPVLPVMPMQGVVLVAGAS